MRGLRSRLDRIWRMLMTGLCFVLFGLGGLTLSLVWFNLLLIFQRDRTQRRRLARRTISASFRLFLAVVRGAGVLDYRFNNLDVLRAERGCLVIANHPSLLDYVLLASVMNETDCLVKSALLRNPFVSGVIRAADYLINSEADTLLAASQQRLARAIPCLSSLKAPAPGWGSHDPATWGGEYRRSLQQRRARGGDPL